MYGVDEFYSGADRRRFPCSADSSYDFQVVSKTSFRFRMRALRLRRDLIVPVLTFLILWALAINVYRSEMFPRGVLEYPDQALSAARRQCDISNQSDSPSIEHVRLSDGHWYAVFLWRESFVGPLYGIAQVVLDAKTGELISCSIGPTDF
jgi:hypothetical protein